MSMEEPLNDSQIHHLTTAFIEVLKQGLRQQEDANSLLARQLKARDKLYAFQRARNEAQFTFSDRMLDRIQEAFKGMKNKRGTENHTAGRSI